MRNLRKPFLRKSFLTKFNSEENLPVKNVSNL